MAKTERRKRNHKFQLNIAKPVEAWLDEHIPKLIEQRKFSQYVREGLSLMIYFAEWGIAAQSVYDLFTELRAGKLNKLFEMFPHLKDNLAGQVITVQPEPKPQAPVDNSKLIAEIKKQVRKTIREEMPVSIPDTSKDYPEMQKAASKPLQPMGQGPKQLTTAKLELPKFEDDDEDLPTIITRKDMTTDSSLNFLTSLQGVVAY